MLGELQVGIDVGGYRIEAILGRGGTSTVYAARHPEIGKQVAIKVLETDLRDSPAVAERMKREARTILAIGHPNIVDVLSFDVLPDGRCFLVMEYLHGETLAQRLRRAPLGAELSDIFLPIIDSLHAVHAAGIVHRDLKPGNVMLAETRTGQRVVKLLDFGVAKVLGDSSDSSTKTGTVLGTPFYLAPEQGRADTIDQRADIYSLGVMLYGAVVGQLPFSAPTPLEIVAKHVHMLPPEPSSIAPDIAPNLNELLLDMLAKRPADRPTLERVRSVLQGRAGAAPAAVVRRSRRWRFALVIGAPTLTATLGLGALFGPAWIAPSNSMPTPDIEIRPPVVPPTPPSFPATSTPATTAAPSAAPIPTPTPEPKPAPRPTRSQAVGTGTLSVTAQPWVSVSVDGVEVAEETPLRHHALTAGAHRIVVENPALGFRKEIRVSIKKDKDARVFVDATAGTVSTR